MLKTPDQILAGLSRGTLEIHEAAVAIEALMRAVPSQAAQSIAQVREAVATGSVSNVHGRKLLAAIERALPGAAFDTVVMADPTHLDAPATALRPDARADATLVMAPAPPAQTLVRPAPVADHTYRAPQTQVIEPTQINEPGQVAEPTQVMQSAPVIEPTRATAADATVRTAPQFPPTAARTQQGPAGTQAAAPYTATLHDKTEVINERRVQSLDETDALRRGALQPGNVVKRRFVLQTLLGKGGMGLVFGAIDRRKQEAQDPNPHVALKVLNADFERHPKSFIALQREARKAQTLAHPNVVTVFDFDRDGDTVYMTMELLKGRSLEAMVREARGKGVKPEVAMPIIRGIAEGLAYAHRKGIVHSDLKPGNIFIAEDGTPKILDFGIARAVPSSVTPENKDVFDAGSLGAYTEAYATDEMIDGLDPHPADDMYALGIIGYELLTGLHPYQRHGARAARKLGIEPLPLKGLKRREARALARCLSFDRRQRPQDAAEFLKLFRGVSTLQKASLAAAIVLAFTAAWFGYENYRETSPAIAFAELPVADQQKFREYMTEGDKGWQFYQRDHIADGLESAVQFYALAYELHPRNREAVAALNKAADAWLATAADDERRRQIAQRLQESSAHYRKYAPVVDAAR